MKKSIKMMTLLLCSVTVICFFSCSKNESAPTSLRTPEALVGEWQCTWNKALANNAIQENAYVGTIWKFGTPGEYSGTYLGQFNVSTDGSYHENVFGEYHFNGTQYTLPQLSVWISEDNGFMWLNGFHEQKPGDAYRLTVNYSIVLTDNTMKLYQFGESVDGRSDEQLILKFKKVKD